MIVPLASVFGDCELGMPRGLLDKVYRYIQEWKTKRLRNALATTAEKRYKEIVVRTMVEYHLPPQFFYLGVQESIDNIKTAGPSIRCGIAKGIW